MTNHAGFPRQARGIDSAPPPCSPHRLATKHSCCLVAICLLMTTHRHGKYGFKLVDSCHRRRKDLFRRRRDQRLLLPPHGRYGRHRPSCHVGRNGSVQPFPCTQSPGVISEAKHLGEVVLHNRDIAAFGFSKIARLICATHKYINTMRSVVAGGDTDTYS